jgi:hypothetical protein
MLRPLLAPMRRVAVGWLAGLLAAGGALGCGIEFLPGSVIVNERVLAVTATPPEAVPGQQVILEPLVVSPLGTLEAAPAEGGFSARWWRCPDEDSDALGDFAQCSVPAKRRDIATGSPYVDTIPLDIFGALPVGEPPAAAEEALPSDKLLGALLGYWRVVGLTMTANGRSVDAFKRIPVYLPVRLGDIDPRLAELDTHVGKAGRELPPNRNPTLSAVTIHKGARNGATTTSLVRGDTYFFKPIFDDAQLEDYLSLKVDLAGLDLSDPESVKAIAIDDLLKRFEKVQRCEVPTFSWYATHGRFRRETTLDEGVIARVFDPRGINCPPVEGEEREPEAQFTAPTGDADDPLPEDGVVRAWVVMRDGRGGTAVRSFELTME